MAIIRIVPCDLEGHALALVVDEQVELAAKESAHGGATPLHQPLEHLVPPDPCVIMNCQLGAIGKVDPGFLGTVAMEEEVKGNRKDWVVAQLFWLREE